jgi:copper chaperone
MRHRIDIDGMTCTGCEAILEREVGDVGDVTDVTADHEVGVVSFATPRPTTGSYVEQVIDSLGYEVTDHTTD